ncbi:vascular endothelial growth factor receptor 1-like [Panulirus ornatus]|uniref:vascular endothelial growth factor receptor 1-like n=1 Tax=Panulirus ornatus TaxID=150431 RepID=UPI003A8C1620
MMPTQPVTTMKVLCVPLLLLLLWQGGSAWSSQLPNIDEGDELVVFTSEDDFSNFSLHCEGTRELRWDWNSTGTSALSLNDGFLSIQSKNYPNAVYPFVSTLMVRKPETSDTGLYQCFYSDEADTTDTDVKAQTYVYVHDGETGLVNILHRRLTATVGDRLVIDCRTTLPNITVELWKEGVLVKPDEERIFFNPREGFIFSNVVEEDDGIYICSTSYSDRIKHNVRLINFTLDPLHTPLIEKEKNEHFVQGLDFRLNCTILYPKKVNFRWVLPNELTVHNTRQAHSMRAGSEYQISTLYVYNATMNDSGVYTCAVRTADRKPNQVTITINIEETLEPYLFIISVNRDIIVNEGDDLTWKTDIRAYPPNPKIIYKNWKGFKLKDSERVSTEYHPRSGESWLRIKSVTANDFGNYSVEGISGNERDSAHVFVQVKSKPFPVLKGVPQFVREGLQLNISCQAKGFPLPAIDFTFKACPDGQQNCSSNFTSIQVKDPEVSTPDPGNIREVKIMFLPQESGILRCEAENEFGKLKVYVEVRISDIGGDFVFRHQGENGTNEVFAEQTIDVVVNDTFSILCAATKFDYKNVHLDFSGSNSTDLQIHKNETEFSRQDQIREQKVSTDLEGTYICKAEFTDTVILERKMIIKVHDEEEVTFTDNANMDIDGRTLEVEEDKPFNLSCTVSGKPTPTVTWFKDDEPLTPDSSFFDDTTFLVNDNQRIELKYVFKKKHVGLYSCRAKNRLGELKGFLEIVTPGGGLGSIGKVTLTVTCLGTAFLVLIIALLTKKVKKEKRFRKSFRETQLYLFAKGNICQLNPDCTADEQAELLPYNQEWEVPRENIKIGKQLGSGAFGRVVKATVVGLDEDGISSTTAAVKMCKSQADQSQVRSLALELKILIHLGKHLNIVNLLGANTVHIGKGELWILVEYCHFGNLLTFMHCHKKCFVNQIDPSTGSIDHLKLTMDATSPVSPTYHNMRNGFHDAPVTDQFDHLASASKFTVEAPLLKSLTVSPPQSPTSLTASSNEDFPYISDVGCDSQGNTVVHDIGSIPGVNAPFSTTDIICWAWQVAQGMDYLTRRKVLHGDLAARNLLLGDNNVVKISDFGLSRELYKKDVYTKKGDDLMPIKWMSVEAIRDRIFSVQSDVWAYGVTLWELFSLGSMPYPDIEVNRNFLQQLEGGYRMDKPKYANQDIYNLLLWCWTSEPEGRPTFTQAADCLEILMLPDLKNQYMFMNASNLRMNEERFQRETDYLSMLSSPDFKNLQSSDDETRNHYVNTQDLSGGNGDNTYLSMKSPDLVEYSCASMTPEASQKTHQRHSKPHKLPENSEQRSPSYMNDILVHNQMKPPDSPLHKDEVIHQD